MKDHNTVLARIAALKTTPTTKLKEQWTALFNTPPPPYNRRFLESRLAYRIQELAYGGLSPRRCVGWSSWANSWTVATSPCAGCEAATSPSPAPA